MSSVQSSGNEPGDARGPVTKGTPSPRHFGQVPRPAGVAYRDPSQIPLNTGLVGKFLWRLELRSAGGIGARVPSWFPTQSIRLRSMDWMGTVQPFRGADSGDGLRIADGWEILRNRIGDEARSGSGWSSAYLLSRLQRCCPLSPASRAGRGANSFPGLTPWATLFCPLRGLVPVRVRALPGSAGRCATAGNSCATVCNSEESKRKKRPVHAGPMHADPVRASGRFSYQIHIGPSAGRLGGSSEKNSS
jgi:hypothetical protein